MSTTINVKTKAWVEFQNRIYHVSENETNHSSAGPLFRLISAVYQTHAFESFRVLRQRIFTNVSSSPFHSSLVRVAAKRCTYDAIWPSNLEGKELVDLSSLPLGDQTATRLSEKIGKYLCPEKAKATCEKLVDTIPLLPERFISARPVSAVLVDKQHHLVLATVNTNAVNRIRHAEVNLVQVYLETFKAPIARGATLYTSLSPCIMCAEMLKSFSEDREGLRVISLKNDLGRLASKWRGGLK